jgi:hypothetical protein
VEPDAAVGACHDHQGAAKIADARQIPIDRLVKDVEAIESVIERRSRLKDLVHKRHGD